MSILNNFPGAKSNSGIIQFLINNIPEHKRYFELFAGSAQLFRAKKEAELSVLVDINRNVADALESMFCGDKVRVWNKSFMSAIQYFQSCSNREENEICLDTYSFKKNDFMYLDPPYPEMSRRSGRKYYKDEMLSADEHIKFIETVKNISNVMVMISTKPNDLYDTQFKGWRKKEFETVDHIGKYTEVIYMNYDEPARLHQYDLLGIDFTDRQRIKRKRGRIVSKIKRLPGHEKNAMIESIVNENIEVVKWFLHRANIDKNVYVSR